MTSMIFEAFRTTLAWIIGGGAAIATAFCACCIVVGILGREKWKD